MDSLNKESVNTIARAPKWTLKEILAEFSKILILIDVMFLVSFVHRIFNIFLNIDHNSDDRKLSLFQHEISNSHQIGYFVYVAIFE